MGLSQVLSIFDSHVLGSPLELLVVLVSFGLEENAPASVPIMRFEIGFLLDLVAGMVRPVRWLTRDSFLVMGFSQ
jgi:hypothetical protein